MPAFHSRRTSSPEAFTHFTRASISPKSSQEKSVGFAADPISSVFRPLHRSEQWTLYDFEMHARSCRSCNDPLSVHRAHRRLCSAGHGHAAQVAAMIYSQNDGEDVFSMSQSNGIVRLDFPRSHPQTKSLLRAIERSHRRPSQSPIIGYERNDLMPPPARAMRPSTLTEDAPRRSALRHTGKFASLSPPRRERSHRNSTDLDHVPGLSRSPSPTPARRASTSGRSGGRRASFGIPRERDGRTESLTHGLASLAIRSQHEDLSDRLLQESPTFEPSPVRRRFSAAGDYATAYRAPAEKRGRSRLSMMA